jgi:predicted outer membrane repeat protein
MLLILYPNILWAAFVPEETARRVAVNHMNKTIQAKVLQLRQKESPDVEAEQRAVPKITVEQIAETFTATDKNILVYYVFNFSPQGWSIISADDVVYPVIGYSESGLYDPNVSNQPPAFTAWMGNVAAEIADAAARDLKGRPEAVEAWKQLSVAPDNFVPDLGELATAQSVLPLIQSTWGQGWDEDWPPYDNDSYNQYCPYIYTFVVCRDYCPTGCVATAMAQIMRYWQWPPFGRGWNGYNPPHPDFGWREMDFSRQDYDWSYSSMPLDGPSTAIARLMRDIGVAVEMDYTPSVSLALMTDAADAFGEYFRYKDPSYEERESDANAWVSKLKEELAASRPILYGAIDGEAGGHAFICDGYFRFPGPPFPFDAFHFNWGWDGNYDGYFALDSLTPDEYNFSDDHCAILGIEPNPYSGPLEVYVDDDYSSDGGNDGHDWHFDAFNRIQDALLVVDSGGTVYVSPGTYYEMIDFKGKAVRVYGVKGPKATFINGTDYYHVVKCVSGEGPDTVLEGFTIAMGRAYHPDNYYDMCGGGMLNIMSSPTVKNCWFTDNSADSDGGGMMNDQSSPTVIDCTFTYNSAEFDGGGMANYQSSPTVTNCTFINNWTQADGAGHGGGMYNRDNSSPTLTNCTFSNNTSSVFGGGMTNYDNSNPNVTNCTFTNNEAYLGGGINNRYSSPTLTNCTFLTNSVSYYGGGIYNDESSPTVINCTFCGNTAAEDGGGMYNWWNSSPTVINCILWDDTPDEIFNDSSDPCNPSEPNVSYSAIQGGWAGPGNIDADPCFVDASSGIVRLRHMSPCIDAGDNSAHNLPDLDLDGYSRIADGNLDGTAVVDIGAYEFQCLVHNVSRDRQYYSIQAAIEEANDADEIEVAPAVYSEAIDFKGKAVRLYSSDGPEVTIIDGTGHYHVVQCINKEDADTILDGFTITGGNADGSPPHDSGAGMWNSGSNPTVRNCTFTSNYASLRGAGMQNENSAPTVINCKFTGNYAQYYGGAVDNYPDSDAVFANCMFIDNLAGVHGGAVSNNLSSPILTNCTLVDNSLTSGAGGAVLSYDKCFTEITNCILWGNSPDQIVDWAGTGCLTTVTNSDVQGGWGGAGSNNIHADPSFVDATGDDFRLLLVSPCIDAGDNNAPSLSPTDLAGRPRVVDGDCDGSAIVDMGAFERQPEIHNITQDCWYVRIQDAIEDSNDGDEIEVAPGTFYESIDFNSKAVRLYSSEGPDLTIINGTGHYHVVQCVSGEGPNTIMEGFTITGGNANGSNLNERIGGGMYCENSSPTVMNCTFLRNEANREGGGMCNEDGSPTVTNCIFRDNTANSGGGMMCKEDSSPTVTNCIFRDNTATYVGGGMYNISANPTVSDCSFSHNTAGLKGGGIYNGLGRPTIINCTIIGNAATTVGGGMCNEISDPTMTNCIFRGNTAGDTGGAMMNWSSSPAVANCTIIGNTAATEGGGMYNESNSEPNVANSILWGNSPNQIVDVDVPDPNWDSSTTVICSDVQGGWVGTGNIDADPCFVDAHNPAPNSWNLRLTMYSPCIDAGDNNSVSADTADLDGDGDYNEPTPFDLNRFPRFIDDLCTVDTGDPGILGPPVLDMGAYEFLPADIDGSGAVDIRDLSEFALHWAETGCGRCGGANMTCEGNVDWSDLRELVAHWLAGTEPEL